ncbi:hypothetical protein KAU11_10745, partial [Candidatus Babeliales bacterium]|nr:hypothetical protein [Candidatus Babeliales bacterium]
ENTIIENCTTVTPILYTGINTRLINNYATDGNPSTNVLQEKTTIIAKTSASNKNIIEGMDSNEILQFAVSDKGDLTVNELNLTLQTFTDDVSAGVGGLVVGALYATVTGELRIKL